MTELSPTDRSEARPVLSQRKSTMPKAGVAKRLQCYFCLHVLCTEPSCLLHEPFPQVVTPGAYLHRRVHP